jgi:hypothetical protein
VTEELRQRVLAAFVPAAMLDDALAEAETLLRAFGIARASGRFGELMRLVFADVTAHRSDQRWSAYPAHTELRHATRIFAHWQHDAVGSEVVQAALTTGDLYKHNVVQLAAATYLTAAGNPVEFVPTDPSRKTADLRIAVTAGDTVLEVKTRQELIDTGARLDADAARDLVHQCLRAASAQLRTGGSGLLGIGGLRVPLSTLDALKAGAIEAFAERVGERTHIAGCLIFSVGMAVEDVPTRMPVGDAPRPSGVHEALATRINPRLFTGEVACRAVSNLNYRGEVPLLQLGQVGAGIRLPYSRS